MPAKHLFFALTATAALAAMPAAAQDDDDAIIIVEGEREVTVGEVREQASNITPRAGYRGQPMPRFHSRVCAGVLGLSVESARLVIDRIHYNAETLGLPVADGEGCEANVIVALADDPHAEFAAMRQERHPLLEGVGFWERERIEDRSDGPVVAWNIIVKKTNDGTLLSGGGGPAVNETTMISRTMTSTTNEIAISVILIDKDAVAGMDGVAIADYATMRALAHTRRPIDTVVTGTILSLFDDVASKPTRLSPFDRAYLAGLYESPENRPMRMTMASIGSRLKNEFERDE